MSSSGCCQLPGSLCDYSGNTETEASKDSEESDSTTQAQYVAKVTAKDGRPLSTVVKADHLQLKSRLEAVGLIALTIALFTIYILWTLVSFRYHCQLYSEWRRTNQKVRLLMPDMKGAHTTQRSVPTKSTKKMTDETIV
ncbi:hypothetical protein GOODEAATRI_020894 [Goodea atripinnis]|uniref:RING-type E3 ubiquitin transferase n=1 Tax=Goodea atripinnis TaxID=208336 RepID=A0ABV0NEN7_9TELE